MARNLGRGEESGSFNPDQFSISLVPASLIDIFCDNCQYKCEKVCQYVCQCRCVSMRVSIIYVCQYMCLSEVKMRTSLASK